MRAHPQRFAGDVGLPLAREGQVRAAAGQRQPQRRMGVVGREHGHAGRAQGFDGAAVFARHGFHRGHEFLVLTLGVVDQGHRGRGDARQQRDFARVVHAQFHHAGLVPALGVLAQAQQRQRHADVVVVVAFGGQRIVAQPGPQDGRDHLRDRGLAVAAGHGDQRQVVLAAPGGGQEFQRALHVGHLQSRQAGCGQAMLGQRGHGTGLARLRQKVVRIEALATQRHEQVARLQRAGVAVHTQHRRGGIAHQQCIGQQRGQLAQGGHGGAVHAPAPALAPAPLAMSRAWRAASAAMASAASENGCFTPWISW